MLVIKPSDENRLKELHRELIEEQKPQCIEHAIEIHSIIRRSSYSDPIYHSEAILTEMLCEKMVGKGMTFNPTSFITTDRRTLSRAESSATSARIRTMMMEKYGLRVAGKETFCKAIPMETPRDVIFTLRALFAIYCIRSGYNYEPLQEALAN